VTNRLFWLDVLRGVLLFLITLGHFEPEGTFVLPLLSPTAMFYVPLFFFFSGLMINPLKYSMKDFVYKRVRTLFVPYVFFVFLFTLLDWNILSTPIDLISQNMMKLALGHTILKATPLWFVSCLFVVSIVHFAVVKNVKKKKNLFLLCVFFSLLAMPLSQNQIVLPWHLEKLPMILVFTISGFLTNCVIEGRKVNMAFVVVLLFIGICGMMLDLGDLHRNDIKLWPLFFLCPISFAVGLVLLLSQRDLIKRNKYTQIFAYISRNGIVVLASHSYWGFVFAIVMGKICHISLEANVFFVAKIVFVYCVLYAFFIPLMNSTFYKCFGKKKVKWSDNYSIEYAE